MDVSHPTSTHAPPCYKRVNVASVLRRDTKRTKRQKKQTQEKQKEQKTHWSEEPAKKANPAEKRKERKPMIPDKKLDEIDGEQLLGKKYRQR